MGLGWFWCGKLEAEKGRKRVGGAWKAHGLSAACVQAQAAAAMLSAPVRCACTNAPTSPFTLAPPPPQALPLLQQRFPIERARMRLRITVPLRCKEELLEVLGRQQGVIEETDLLGGCRDRVVCGCARGWVGESADQSIGWEA